MSTVTDTQQAYLEMRGDGQPFPVATAILGVEPGAAVAWENLEQNRRERLTNASGHTADRLIAALRVADGGTLQRILGELDTERKNAVVLALAARVLGVTDCLCGHLDIFHDLNPKKQRTACSWHEGPQCTPCGCKRFQEAS